MIEIIDLTFAYDNQEKPVFSGFSWRAVAGEHWAVIGPSGCGKSTLLYLLAGLRLPQAGAVLLSGMAASDRSNRGRTGLVLQDYGLLPWATVWDNARLGRRIQEFYGRTIPGTGTEPVRYWLERLGIGNLADKYPAQISGGERQRVAIARALALQPHLLLLDEPFSALDAIARQDLEALMLNLWAETGLTAIFVTHSIEEAVLLGSKILVLQKPPNRQAKVVENSAAGTLAYMRQPDFLAKCEELRTALTV